MPKSEFDLLLDDLCEVQARRSAQALHKAIEIVPLAQLRRTRPAAAARSASLQRTMADLEDMAKSVGAMAAGMARQSREQRRARAQGVLAKALDLCREGRITALQVAEIEARLHRLAPVLR